MPSKCTRLGLTSQPANETIMRGNSYQETADFRPETSSLTEKHPPELRNMPLLHESNLQEPEK